MNHLERGFVVPVWRLVAFQDWRRGWAQPTTGNWTMVIVDGGKEKAALISAIRPRDPNNADGTDRPA